jgi:putative transposase
VLDALERARHNRVLHNALGSLVVLNDPESQAVSMRDTTPPAAAGAAPSVSSVGRAFASAPAESLIDLFMAAVTRLRGPWRSCDDVRLATLAWVARLNTQRLLQSLAVCPGGSTRPVCRAPTTPKAGDVGYN